MKLRIKQIITFTLVATLSLAVFVVNPAPSHAATKPTIQSAINKVKAVYPDGSYFTTDGKPCPSNTADANSLKYRLFNRCIGFTRYATAQMFGTNTVGYNYLWGNTLYFTKIGSASATNATAVAALLQKAKPGDVVEVIRTTSPTYQHAMIFLSAQGTDLYVYHANWQKNCNIAYNQKVNFSNYTNATMSIYHSKNYEYRYGTNGDGVGGPVTAPRIKLNTTVTIAQVDKPLMNSIGVRVNISNPLDLYVGAMTVQYRAFGTTTFKNFSTKAINTYGTSRTNLFTRVTGLANNKNYEFRVALKVDGQTLYSDIVGPYLTHHLADIPYTVTGGKIYYCPTSHSIVDADASVTSVGVPTTVSGKPVVAINSGAFYRCTKLKSVTLPTKLTTIRTKAFSQCTSLQSVTIPKATTLVGSGAFEGCTNLQTIKVAIGNTSYVASYGVLYNAKKTAIISYPMAKTTFTVPNTITAINGTTFYKCTKLTSIKLPSSVKTIAANAFSGCTGLTSITIPGSVASIGSGAFTGCTKLTGITIPNSVTSLGTSAFSGCKSLTSATLSKSLTTVEQYTFESCSKLNNVVIPDKVTIIRIGAFQDCIGLKTVTIPSSVTIIGDYAFERCPLTTVYGVAGSVAETYASERNIRFVELTS
ncbi:MAG: leucine-rich repeat domain-containing protein [Coriobacteriia bacterium]|nr:leucine-rich repeat domain-containing protein [Coriobacteriia bacterium]